jgi:hypothetical protein
MSLGNVWIGHKLSRRMPLVNWQRWQEIGLYLSTLCEFCFRFGFRFWLRFIFRFLFISYATCKLTAAMCFDVQNQQLMASVWCKLLYSLYCISKGQAEQHYTLFIWSTVCTPLCSWLPFWQRQPPPVEVPLELKIKIPKQKKSLVEFLLLIKN